MKFAVWLESQEIKIGDKVRIKGGTMIGEVLDIIPGEWSNGGVPMVKVKWEGKFPTIAKISKSNLEIV